MRSINVAPDSVEMSECRRIVSRSLEGQRKRKTWTALVENLMSCVFECAQGLAELGNVPFNGDSRTFPHDEYLQYGFEQQSDRSDLQAWDETESLGTRQVWSSASWQSRARTAVDDLRGTF